MADTSNYFQQTYNKGLQRKLVLQKEIATLSKKIEALQTEIGEIDKLMSVISENNPQIDTNPKEIVNADQKTWTQKVIEILNAGEKPYGTIVSEVLERSWSDGFDRFDVQRRVMSALSQLVKKSTVGKKGPSGESVYFLNKPRNNA